MAVQADGKILVGGESDQPAGADFAVARLNVDGSLDTSFDGDGKRTIDFGSPNDYGNSVAVQADGRILVGGYSYQSVTGNDFAVARLNTDGSLDTAFDGDGKATVDFGNSYDIGNSVAVQADGRILVGGYSYQPGAGTGLDLAVVRLNADGSMDTSFDGDGERTIDFGGSDDYGQSVAVQADGRILVGGYRAYNGVDFEVARLNADGTLDASFDGDGEQTVDFGNTYDYGYSVAVQADGKVLVGGYSYQGPTGADLAVARLDTNGSLDASFDVDGKRTIDFGNTYDYGYSVAVQADGRVLVGGYSGQPGTGADFAVARLNTNGSLDTGFDGDGRVTTEFGRPSDDFIANSGSLAVQADGKIVAVGYSFQSVTGNDFAVVRYNTDGTLDGGFGTGGTRTIDFGTPSDIGLSVAVQADGKILIGGYSNQPGTGYDFAVARLNGDGSLDTTFDGDGKRTISFGNRSDFGSSVAVQADGKILVGGYSIQPTTGADFAVARLNADGSLDISFDGDGKRTIDFGSSNDSGSSVAVQADGKILVAGFSSQTTTAYDFAVARLNADGSLDTAFDGDGKQTIDFGNTYDFGFSVGVQADGKVLVGGYWTSRGPGPTSRWPG